MGTPGSVPMLVPALSIDTCGASVGSSTRRKETVFTSCTTPPCRSVTSIRPTTGPPVAPIRSDSNPKSKRTVLRL